MMSGEGGDFIQMARLANGTMRHQKAIYDGDTKGGFMFVGQATGPIRDLPPVKSLIERVMVEAEATLRKTGAMAVS